MNDLTVIEHNGQFGVDSREVAEMVGKMHKDLLESIRGYNQHLVSGNFRPSNFFIESTYIDSQNREKPCYLLTRKGCDMVANKMTGEKGVLFTAAYVTKFEEMEKAQQPQNNLEALDLIHKQFSLLIGTQKKTNERINELDDKFNNQITMDHGQQRVMQRAVSHRVIYLLGGKKSDDYKKYSKIYFAAIYRDIKNRLGVPSYRDVKKKDYEMALGFIENWLPETTIRDIAS